MRHTRFRWTAIAMILGLILAACASSPADDTGSAEAEGGDSETVTDGAASDGEGAESDAASGDFGVERLELMSRWVEGTPEAEAFSVLAEAYTVQTGVEIELIGEAGEDLDVAYETAVLGGAEPHAILINLFDKSIGWIDQEIVVDVGDYVEEWGLSDTVDAESLEEWTKDGQVQGFPYSGFAWPIWYNTALLQDAGVDGIPETTDDLLAAAAILREAGIAPMVVGGSDWSGQKLFMQIAQSYLETDVTQGLLQEGGWCGDDDAMRGIGLFTTLRDGDVFIDEVEGYTADLMNETFYSGDAAIMPAGSWAFAGANDVAEDVTLGGFPLPSDSAFDEPTVYQGFTGVGLMISPRGEEEALDALEAFVQTMYSEEVYGAFVGTANIVPAIELSDTAVASDPLLRQALEPGYTDATEVALLMDVYVPPGASDGVNQAIGSAYSGSSADEICAGLDGAY